MDGGPGADLGRALAYYTVFSLAPLLTISIAIAAVVFGQEAAQGQIFEQLRGLLGEASGRAVQDMVQNATAKPTAGVLATLISVAMLLFGASGVFGQLQASLNAIWGVKPKPGRGVLGLIQDRVLSFGFTLVVGFLLLVSLLLTAAIALIAEWIGGMMPSTETLTQVLNFILSLGLVTLLFAMMFKFLPDAEIGCLDRSFSYGSVFWHWEIRAWAVLGKKWRYIFVWRRGLADRAAALGLLFLADIFLRRRVYPGLCQSPWLARYSSRECGACRARLTRYGFG